MEVLGYLAALAIGVTLGLMGGGGSILTVPTLHYLFGLSARTATAYSLFVVGSTALVGAAVMARRGLVAAPVALAFLAPSFLTVTLTRHSLLPALPGRLGFLRLDTVLLVFFALLMLLTGLSMLRPRVEPGSEGAADLKRVLVPGLVVGLVTGLVGAGGGFLIVPALTLAAGLPIKRAVGTSLAVIATNSLLGFFADTQVRPHADYRFLGAVTGTAILGMGIGTGLSRHVPAARLRPAFGVFLLVMGTVMVIRELLAR